MSEEKKEPKSYPRRCAYCGEPLPEIGICYCMESEAYGNEDDYPDGYDEYDERDFEEEY